jgi:mRNA interferase YafQ
MRTINYTARFKRDFKREKKSGHYRATLDTNLLSIVKLLATGPLLPQLIMIMHNGDWKDHRDCIH